MFASTWWKTMSSVRAIVAGHGEFGTGILSAVLQITGREDVFLPLSNRGLSAQDVERALGELVARSGASVIFTDLPAGSCTMAARRLQRSRPDLTVVTGTNLGVLLDFLFADDGPASEAARVAADKGRASVMVTPARPAGGAGGTVHGD
jgi:PTS system N-acetylgalactosamine-specific IIA component